MKLLQKIIFIGILLFFSTYSCAQRSSIHHDTLQELYLINLDTAIDLSAHIYYFEDESLSLEFSDVLAQNISFTYNKDKKQNFGYSKSAYWFKFSCRADDFNENNWFLEINYPPLNEIVFYYQNSSAQWDSLLLGAKYSANNREYRASNYIIPLHFTDSLAKTYYLKIQSESSLQIPLCILGQNNKNKSQTNRTSFYSMIFGFFIIIFLFSLFLFINIKSKAYLYYLVSIIGSFGFIFAMSGYFDLLLLNKLPQFSNPIRTITGGLWLLGSSMFAIHFLEIKNKILRRVFEIISIYAVIQILTAFYIPYYYSVKVWGSIAAIFPLFIIVVSIYKWLNGTIQARFYVFAWLFYLIGTITLFGRLLGFFPINTFTTYSNVLPSVLEAILIMYALIDKQKIIELSEKNAQVELLENEEKITEILENNVAERTSELVKSVADIQQQNEEISTINNTLASSNIIIDNQNDILRKHIAELRNYSLAIEQSPITIVITDVKGNIEYANSHFFKLTGYRLDEVVGKNPSILKSGHTPKEIYRELWKVIRSGEIWRGEFINKKKNGEEFIEKTVIAPVKNENGKITNFIAVKEDITEHKESEDALVRSEKKYKNLIQNLGEGIIVTDLSENILFVNPAAERIFGVKPDGLFDKNLKDFLDSEQLEILERESAKRTHFETSSYDIAITRPNNEKISILVTATPQLNENGDVITVFGTFNDITDRKRIQLALIESEERFRTIFNHSNDAIMVSDFDESARACFIFVNSVACSKLEYTEQELLSLSPNKITRQEDDVAKESNDKLLKDKNIIHETIHITKSGKEIPVEINSRLVVLQGRNVIVSVVRDISNRKRTQKKLKAQNEEYALLNEEYKILNNELINAKKIIEKSEEKQRQILDTFNDGIYINSSEYKIEYINSALQEKLGRNPIGEDCFKVLYNLEEKCSWCIYNQLNEDKKEIEYKLKVDDNKILAVNNVLLESKSKLSVFQDITERIKDEEQLRLLSSVIEQSPVYILITDTKARIEYANPAFTEITGFSMNEVIGRNPGFLKSGKVKQEVYVDLWNTISKGKPWYGQFINMRKNGEEYYEQVLIAPVKNEDGEIIRYFAIKEDVTEARKNELALNEAQKIAKLGNWELDIVKDKLYWSDEIYRMFDLEPQKFKATYAAFLENIHPDDRDEVNEAYSNSLKTKQPYNITHRLKLASGEIKYVNEMCTTEFDKDGNPLKSVGVVQDITSQKIAEKALAESEDKYKQLIKNARSAIIKLDKDGFITFFNEYASELFEYKESEVLGEHVISTIVPGFDSKSQDLSKMVEMFLSSTGKHYETINENENITKSGKKIFMSWSNKAIVDNNGSIIEIISTGIDITDRKKAEEKLKKQNVEYLILNEEYILQNLELKIAKQEADEANKLKSEFLANMSHEIRTPMNAIIGFSSILKKKIKNEEHRSFIIKIAKNGNNLLGLINDILDLSKIEAGQLDIQKEPANLHLIFNEIPVIFSQVSQQKNIPIKISIDKNLPKSLLMDLSRIRQVLINLVSNALKFTEKGSIQIDVKIIQNPKLVEEKKLDLAIEVRDTGIGIPKDQLNAIFSSFRQIDGQSTKKYGGTGLGLTISRRLVELLDGTLDVESVVGKGSVFKIMLENVVILAGENQIIDKNQNVNIIFEKSNILHVEDNVDNRDLISLYLEDENVTVKEVETGKEALEILKVFVPDLILMDIQLPELNGYDTTKIIRRNEKLKNIPIIALTANATKEEIEKYSHVFDEYITKPVDEDIFIKTISKYLSHKKEDSVLQTEIEQENFILELIELKKEIIQFPIEMQNELRNEVEPIYKDLAQILSVDKLNTLIEIIKNIAEKYQVEILLRYSNTLNLSVNNFDFNRINQLLTYFPEMIKIICE